MTFLFCSENSGRRPKHFCRRLWLTLFVPIITGRMSVFHLTMKQEKKQTFKTVKVISNKNNREK